MAFKDEVRELTEKIREWVLEQARRNIPGPDKLELVAKQAAEWLDEQIKFKKLGPFGLALEAIDGVILKTFAKFLVQTVYNQLVDERRV